MKGVLRGTIAGTGRAVRASRWNWAPHETKVVAIDPQPVMQNPASLVAGELRRTVSLRPGAGV